MALPAISLRYGIGDFRCIRSVLITKKWKHSTSLSCNLTVFRLSNSISRTHSTTSTNIDSAADIDILELTSKVKRLFNEPLIRRVSDCPVHSLPVQAWISTLEAVEDNKRGIAELHPDIFSTFPRLDSLHRNLVWQRWYKRISYFRRITPADVRGRGRKPWPQKGTGRARHGSRLSHIWVGGGRVKGAMGPTSHFYELPLLERIRGLRVALTVKFAQDDLQIVQDLEVPYADPNFLLDLAKHRKWGKSVLFVGIKEEDELGASFLSCIDSTKSFTYMPLKGLNVHSMLKYHTLVLAMDCIDTLESRLLTLMNGINLHTLDNNKTQLGNLKDVTDLGLPSR